VLPRRRNFKSSVSEIPAAPSPPQAASPATQRSV
jgi:hypothetical protein